ncbi:MAG TPA: hypothetical protein VI756_20420 [Blastocatellia bacterium]
MYRKPRFLEELHAIREEMSRECDYDIDLFAQMVRSGQHPRFRGPLSDADPDQATAPSGTAEQIKRGGSK